MALLLSGCGGGDSSSTALLPFTPYEPTVEVASCQPGDSVIGVWKTLANNATLIPDSPGLNFFSYNQPSVNAVGMVVFRGRAKESGDGGSGTSSSAMLRGVFALDACLNNPTMYTVADTHTLVPAPNSTSANFTEFPSIPRIDMDSAVLATRGQSDPVWTLDDGTRVGTSGIYATLNTGLTTGVGLLGNVPQFSYQQVPGASTSAVRFDQFPGSPTVTTKGGTSYLVFKGNYTDTDAVSGASVAKTGVYFRDLGVAQSPVQLIADSNMAIPNAPAGIKFGSTAPPSAAGGNVVFLGVDNESSPSYGGLYSAEVKASATLNPLVIIGQTVVPDPSGVPLAGNPTFSQLGEGLSYDGRYIAFWGAWDTATTGGMRDITLNCPGDGKLATYCASQFQNGQTTMPEPVNQGIFVYDTNSAKLWMTARAGSGEQFQDLLFWTYSGAPPVTGGGSSTDAEPPRWRASAFAAVNGYGVLFKGVLNPSGSGTTAAAGIYGNSLSGGAFGSVFKVLEMGDAMAAVDPAAPANSTISSLGMERESLRAGWLTMTISSLDPSAVGWAGIYATYFPGAFNVLAPTAPATMGQLKLGR